MTLLKPLKKERKNILIENSYQIYVFQIKKHMLDTSYFLDKKAIEIHLKDNN